jgi:hypothetical protein
MATYDRLKAGDWRGQRARYKQVKYDGPKDHFAGIRKMVDLGSGAKREIDDIALNRYACYLIAQNGDPDVLKILINLSVFPLTSPP